MTDIINLIIALLIVIFMVSLGYIVFIKNRESVTNRYFFLFTVSMAVWGMFNFFETWFKTQYLAALFLKLDFFVAPYMSLFALLFLLNFPRPSTKLNSFIASLLLILPVFFVSAITFTEQLINNIRITDNELKFEFGNLAIFYIIIIFVYIFYGIANIIWQHRKAQGISRQQIRYVLFGFLITGSIMTVFNLLLQNKISEQFFRIINFSPIILISCIAYAIIAHRLMDIKLVMRKYSVYLASLSSIILLAVGLKYLFDSYVARYTDWADFFILAGGVSVFPGIKNRYYFLANKYFFSSLYDSRQVIAGLSEKLRSTLDIKAINKSIADTLINSFHAKAVAVLTYDEKTNEYAVQYNSGFTLGGQKRFSSNDMLRASYVLANKSIIVEELKENIQPGYKETLELLLKFKAAILTPLNIKDKNIGLIALGRKESGDMYNNEDLQVLKVVGAQAAIAIEKALLYKQVHDFSRTLQGKVDEQTKDIRAKSGEIEEKNKYLKELLEMKTDFLRVVNHQLNTPLSVMKGYFSMMEEDAYPAEKAMPSIKNGLERISSTVADFWNAYELEGERMKIEPQKADIAEIVSRLIPEKQNMQMARERELSIEVKPPDFNLPIVWCDYKKISHVVSNLLDNAVYYTRQGKITVFYELADNYLKISVKDTGVGLSEEDKKKMFQKFSRGGNATDLRPDGSGLGLFIAKKIVEGNFGQLFCSSEGRDKGSTFAFTLPLHKDQQAEAAREKPVSREKIVIFNKVKP